MSIMNETQAAPLGATPIPPSGGTGAPSPKIDIGGSFIEFLPAKPQGHPKPENASLFPWDDLHTRFIDFATRYAAEMQEARKIADQWWYACLAARKERDELKAQVAELERALAQLRGDGFAVS